MTKIERIFEKEKEEALREKDGIIRKKEEEKIDALNRQAKEKEKEKIVAVDEAEQKSKKKIAVNLLSMGMDIPDVIKATGLKKTEVLNLKKDLTIAGN